MNDLLRETGKVRRTRERRWAVGPGLLALLLIPSTLASRTARADDPPSKASCAEAYESAQESRASGRLRQTQQRLAYCAQEACPSFVKTDCARWLEEVERELPSVVVSTPGLSADDLGRATLKLDGEVVDAGLSGSSVALDPGRHELSLERPGHEPVLRTIIAQQGVQDRRVSIDFQSADSGSGFGLRPLSYVAFGAGAVGFGIFGAMGILARADKDALRNDCGTIVPTPEEAQAPAQCLQTEFDSRESDYQSKEVIADVGLVLGIAGAAAGATLFILSLDDSSAGGSEASARNPSLRLEAGATVGGAWATLHGRF